MLEILINIYLVHGHFKQRLTVKLTDIVIYFINVN